MSKEENPEDEIARIAAIARGEKPERKPLPAPTTRTEQMVDDIANRVREPRRATGIDLQELDESIAAWQSVGGRTRGIAGRDAPATPDPLIERPAPKPTQAPSTPPGVTPHDPTAARISALARQARGERDMPPEPTNPTEKAIASLFAKARGEATATAPVVADGGDDKDDDDDDDYECTDCGADISMGAIFCSMCAGGEEPEQRTGRSCSGCDQRVGDKYFCRDCAISRGYKPDSSAASTASTATPATPAPVASTQPAAAAGKKWTRASATPTKTTIAPTTKAPHPRSWVKHGRNTVADSDRMRALDVACPQCKVGRGVACLGLEERPGYRSHLGRASLSNRLSGRVLPKMEIAK